MHIYVVRHGETQWNKEEVFRGTQDIPLNETGKKQAEKVGRYFIDKDVVRIVSSPLARARQTAEAIERAVHRPVETMDEFIDMNFGIWEGLSLHTVKKEYGDEFQIWRNTPHRLKIEKGETLLHVRKRMKRGFEKAVEGGKGTIIIVTHRVLCKLIVLYAFRMPNSHFWDIKFDPASITLIEKDAERLTVCFFNDTCHLKIEDRVKGYKDF